MRVAHLITRLIRGGADENTLITVEELCRAGDDVTLIIGKEYDDDMAERAIAAGAKVKVLPLEHFKLTSAIRALLPLKKVLRKGAYDIVHTHETEMGIVGRLAAKMAGIKRIVHTVHGVPFSKHRPLWINMLVWLMEKHCAGFTNRIITNSDTIRRQYMQKGIGIWPQYITIRSGIDLSRYQKPMRTSSCARPTVTIISRLANGKGHTELLKAVANLKEKVPNLRCWIVGDGEEHERIAEFSARLGLNKCVSMMGYRSDIPAILSETTVLALPSYWEGTPRSISEAMAAGVPVVATPVGGIPEQVQDGDNGYLIPVKDHEALAKKLYSLLIDPDLAAEMGTRGREKAKEFSKEKMITDIRKIYCELMNSAIKP